MLLVRFKLRGRQSLSLYYPRFNIILTTIPHHLTHLAKKLRTPISTKVSIIGLGGKDHDKDETKLKTCPETLPEKSNEFQGQTRHGRVRASVAYGTARAGTGNGKWLMD